MATKRPARPRRTPLQEAYNTSTAPERLEELADHEDEEVQEAAWKNPSLPEDAWREVLLRGEPVAWDNPMASFYVLAWTPRENDPTTLEEAVQWATQALWEEPERCSSEGKALIAAKVQAWWSTSEDVEEMTIFLGDWVRAKGDESIEHREVVRILVLCVRTVPDLTDEDRRALDLINAWTAGGEDRRNEAQALASSQVIQDVCRLLQHPSNGSSHTIFTVLKAIEIAAGEQARAEHSRLMADVIRRAMPLPPVVD
jgi:hypothetical protein